MKIERNIIILLSLIALLFLTALLLLGVNAWTNHFQGNLIFDSEYQRALIPTALFVFAVLYCKRYLSKRMWVILSTFGLYALCLDAGVLIAQAIQTTPFPTIDHYLIQFDQWLGFDQIAVVQFAHAIPWLHRLLIWGYNSIIPELLILPMFMAILGEGRAVMTFMFALLISYFIGTLIYYFFPTIAPAALFHSPLFTFQEHDTYIKFYEIHHHLMPTTTQGGMIAFPSFHVIWASLLIYVTRPRWWLFLPLLAWNAILISSTMLLGWHYLADALCGIVLAAGSIWVSEKIYS